MGHARWKGGVGDRRQQRLGCVDRTPVRGRGGALSSLSVMTPRRPSSSSQVPGARHRASRTPTQDTSAIEGLAAEIDATEGRLDILVNNADTTRVILHADLYALD